MGNQKMPVNGGGGCIAVIVFIFWITLMIADSLNLSPAVWILGTTGGFVIIYLFVQKYG